MNCGNIGMRWIRANVTAAQTRNRPLRPAPGSTRGELGLGRFFKRPPGALEIAKPGFGGR